MSVMTRSIEAARRAVAQRNATAARVERLREQLYLAEERLRAQEAKAWASLPDGATITLGTNNPWKVNP